MCETLNNKIRFAVENFVPKRRLDPQNTSKNWENLAISRVVKKKKQKWTVFKRNPSRRNKNAYNRFSKYVSKEVKRIKSEYERNKFHGRHDNPKEFYNYVDRVTGNKRASDIPQLEVNNVKFTTDYQKSLALADQYKSVYPLHDENLPNIE